MSCRKSQRSPLACQLNPPITHRRCLPVTLAGFIFISAPEGSERKLCLVNERPPGARSASDKLFVVFWRERTGALRGLLRRAEHSQSPAGRACFTVVLLVLCERLLCCINFPIDTRQQQSGSRLSQLKYEHHNEVTSVLFVST